MSEAGRPIAETQCVVCKGYLQYQQDKPLDEDGVCPTCNSMMNEDE